MQNTAQRFRMHPMAPVQAARLVQEAQAAWDRRIDGLLSRLAYWQALAGSYTASDVFAGRTLLFAQQRSGTASEGARALLAAGGPGGAWQRISLLVQPVEAWDLPSSFGAGGGTGSGASGSRGSGSAGPSSPSSAVSAARLVQAALLTAAREAAEEESASPEETAAEQVSSMLLSPRPPMSPTPFSPVGVGGGGSAVAESDTVSVVLPLNRLCPERRYILRYGQAGRSSGTPPALLTPPLVRLPLWLVHSETGSITVGLKGLAAALPLPCYGLGMGGDVSSVTTLAELAAHYVAAVQAVQPHGPYLLAGCSVSGSAVAHAMAVRMQATGQRAGLILLDGCLGQPAGLTLHDPTWWVWYRGVPLLL